MVRVRPDAADASVAMIFGRMGLTGMRVSCVSNDFMPFTEADLKSHAVMIVA
jgi:hypothetical protein